MATEAHHPRTTTDVSHLQQLRKGTIALDRTISEAPIRRLLNKTEHFVFTAVPEWDEEILASVEAMCDAGVFRLPYPVCTFEFSANLLLDGEIKYPNERTIVLLTETESGPRLDHWFVRSGKNKHQWIGISFEGDGGDPREPLLTDNFRVGIRVDGHSENATTRGGISALCSCLLVALATKGIQRERWIGDKKVLVGRKEPADAYTRVMVAETLSTGQGHRTPGERLKVRLHLRRGHTRNQPHGPGRQYTRVIFIEPQLIGYAEEGRVTHEHYEAYPHQEQHA
jgi:hypothetical protein